jgi:Mrp family chromosome partitioning ATPase
MSRMLEALRQIEARSPQPQAPPDTQAMPAEQPATLEPAAAALAQAEAAAAGIAAACAPCIDLSDADVRVCALRKLADRVLSRLPTGTSAVLLLASPDDGAGTTAVLVPLAAALAERLDGKVLLVDANFRHPELARVLEVETSAGLPDVLMGKTRWRQVVRETAVPRLSVLPGARFPMPNTRAAERFNLEPLLRELRAEYRLVLIDAASLAHAEVASLLRHCDGVYLVVRLLHTLRRAVGEAVRAIQAGRGRLLGCVVLEATAPAGPSGW